ncbi:DUF5131 family protein [Marinicauda sp. Alg238-R41]|uniref:DUF5131 family protein n=1 Tax=Marinicauda sp. Alg238-R41 TaxID=2993447 RepID=UPI0022E11471|nr:phage Gp37/Gp68 family protein [Marinicauda sp. Alg238-R41]
MAAHATEIEWTHIPGYKGESWNPVVGCSVTSAGCTNCYAMKTAGNRLDGNPRTPHYAGTTKPSKAGPVWTGKIGKAPEKTLTAPLRWTKPRAVFVNSMGDLFHPNVPADWIDEVFAVMALCPQHIFMVLTKHPYRMRDYMRGIKLGVVERVVELLEIHSGGLRLDNLAEARDGWERWWPLSNVWLGVSAEDQDTADSRIPLLLETPAAARFVSCEPLLEAVDLTWLVDPDEDADGVVDALRGSNWIDGTGWRDGWPGIIDLPRYRYGSGVGRRRYPQRGEEDSWEPATLRRRGKLDWVIAGGESGPGARPMHPDWVRSLRDQCAAAGTPFLFKQWGEYADHTERHAASQCCDGRADLVLRADGKIIGAGAKNIGGLVEHGWQEQGAAWMCRVGKKAAGRTLDGVEHLAWPERPAGRAAS